MIKVKRLNEDLIDFVAGSIDTLLAIVGFLALYPVVFVLIATTIGYFVRKNYIEGIIFLALTVTVYYLGKGILRYLEEKEQTK